MTRSPTLVAFAIALVSTRAAAQTSEDAHRRAGESFRQAQAAFGRGELSAAAAAFEQAADFEPHPAPLLDAADAWERAGDAVRAIRDCDRAGAMPGIDQRFRSAADDCVRRLAPRVATLDLRGPRTVQARVDGGDPTSLPLHARLAPGDHVVVEIDLDTSRSRTEKVTLAAGESRTLDVQPLAAEPAPQPQPQPEPRSQPTAAPPTASWISFGVGGAAVATGVVFGLITLKAKDDYDAGPTVDRKDAFHRDVLVTDVAFGVGAAAVALGVVLWLASPRTESLALSPTGPMLRF